MTVSTSHGFLWYEVPKVASRTIRSAIEETAPKGTNRKIRLMYLAGRYRNYYKFAFVRNPWDRLVSAWVNKVRERNYVHFHFDAETHARMQDFPTFARWVAEQDLSSVDRHLRRQVDLIDLSAANFIGKLERFDTDIATVCEAIDVEPPQSRIGATQRSDYCDYYNTETQQVVARAYEHDIERFEYHF